MQHQTATAKRKKKSTQWGLAAILFCLNVAIYYLLFVWPSSPTGRKQLKAQEPVNAKSVSNADIATSSGKH
jgi:hypothetical protein